MDDVARIAGSLTKAQDRFMRRLYVSDRRGYWPMYNALAEKGLVTRTERLTPLGAAVRAHLSKGADDANQG